MCIRDRYQRRVRGAAHPAMSTLWVSLLVLLCSLAQGSAKRSSGWDMFVLSQYWPGSSCDLAAPCNVSGAPARSFLLHGLWPTAAEGSFPSFCDRTQQLDQKSLAPIRDQLDQLWVDTAHANNFQWWQYEWNKHGPCAQPILASQLQYFSAALKLRMRYDLLGMLSAGGIRPGQHATLQELSTVLGSGLGLKQPCLLYTSPSPRDS
eukprot:TRINITY_DN61499_c0_g1_i1.p1 TRINITY_DN61499_c0_g1~~TRINITY_DN61499_c0_g1_i1.p1  ORF type:complete len:206 (-),score=33.02 TRINITY_DN61499_c0_g1_i1:132-749(-)